MAGPSLGTAYVQVVASADGIKGSLTKALSGEAGAAGSRAGSLISGKLKGAIAAAGIGTALVGGLKAALAETGELQQSYLGGIDTLYGDAAEKAREYARAAAEAGISQSNFSQQAVSFGAALKQAYGGDTTKSIEAANTAILDMADNAAKMGTPLESIQQAYQGFAKNQYMLLDNLKLGYGGTKTEMERLLSDAEAITGVKYDIDNLGDVYDAIHVIQGELGLTGVAAEEAASTLTGSAGAMKASLQNLIGNIGLGENIEPAMTQFVTSFSTYFFGNLIPTIGTIMKSLPTAIGTFISEGAPQISAALSSMLAGLKDGLGDSFSKLVSTLPSKMSSIISTIMNGLVQMSGKIRSLASILIPAGLQLIKSLAQGVINSIPTFIQTVPTIISNFAGIINDNAPKVVMAGAEIVAKLVVGIVKAIPVLVANLPKVIKAIVDLITAFAWGGLGKTVIKGIASGLKAAGGALKTALTKPVSSAKKVITEGFTEAKNKVSDIFTSIKTAITDKINAAKDTVKGAIDKIKGFFPLSVGKIFSNIKVPHINVSGGKAPYGIGGFGTKPSISVSWNKKAMENPYMFSGATLFGAGETGDEMLYGRKALMNDIREATGGGGEVIINLNYDASDDANDMLRDLVRGVKRYRMAGVI